MVNQLSIKRTLLLNVKLSESMSETSATITGKIMSLLRRVDDINVLIAYGFVREAMKNVNKEISHDVNYCIIYAFLAINEWVYNDEYYVIDTENQNRVRVLNVDPIHSHKVTIYADPIIDIDNAKGKYEWKIKINDAVGIPYIGITNYSDGLINSHFYGARGTANLNNKSSYCYASIGTKMDHTMSGSVNYHDDEPSRYGTGDIITVHLDLDKKSVGFSKNDEYLGIAFENINSGKYRFAISIPNTNSAQFEFIQ